MFTNWTWPNFFSKMHDIFVPLALVILGLATDPNTSGAIASALGTHGVLIVGAIGALAHLGDSQVNSGLPPKP